MSIHPIFKLIGISLSTNVTWLNLIIDVSLIVSVECADESLLSNIAFFEIPDPKPQFVITFSFSK